MNIAFITFGCSLNQADSESMMGLLRDEGFAIVKDPEQADLVVVNSCTVKNLAETKFFRTLNNLKDKKVVIAGCIPQAEEDLVTTKLKDYSIIGTSQLDRIVHIVQETIEGNIVQILGKKDLKRLSLPKIRRNEIVDIIPISEGCLGNCTYCKTKQARGNLISYPIDSIVTHATQAIKDNCKEIWLTSQDCGAYGLDINTDLVELLEQVLKIDGDFKVRIGMANPNHTKSILNKLILLFENPKLFKFIHLPVQSGNNEVLKAMNRFYTVEDYEDIISKLRTVKDITIATDIICGFPTETEDQLLDSIKLVKTTKPDVINVSRYWPRPGTKAANLQLHSGGITKERAAKVLNLFRLQTNELNQRFIGQTKTIIIDEPGKEGDWLGRTDEYRQVVVKGDHQLGSKIKIEIIGANEHYFIGKEV